MSRSNPLFAIACLCVMSGAALAAKPDGLMAEWNFDNRASIDGKGDVARDSSGNGHDAKLHGPAWVRHGKGFVINLDGFDDYVNCGKSVDLGLGGPATLELWIKLTHKAHGESNVLGEGYNSYVLTVYATDLCYWYIGDGGNNLRSKLTLYQWYHVAATFDGNQIRMFVNGRHVASKESDHKTYSPAGNFLIGTKGAPKSAKFKGMVDRVRVYNRAISDKEALAHFEAEKDEYIDLTWLGRVKVAHYYYTDSKEAVVEADYRALQPLQGAGRLDVTLSGKDRPKEIIKQKKIDSVSGREGMAEVALPCGDLAAGDYIVKVVLTDGHGAFPIEEFTFSHPQKPRPLSAPAEKTALPLPPKRGPTPFKLEMGKGGGFTLTVREGNYPFISRISWPHGDFNRLSPGDAPFAKGEESWKADVRAAGENRYQVKAGGDSYTIHRDLEVFPTHVYIKDTYTNTTDEDLGLLIYNETLVKPEQVDKSLLSGYERRGRQQDGSTDYGPSVFFTDANAGMGILPIDDVYVVQAATYVDWQGAAGVGTERFALASGKSYTLEWAVYPTGSGDYYDFINAFRKVENRMSTIDGAAGYITYGGRSRRMIVDAEFIEKRGITVGITPCIGDPVDDPNLDIEGIEFIDFPKERALLRQQTTATHKKHPGLKLVFHIAHSLFATNNPDRFADSRVMADTGKPATWGDGRYFGEENAKAGWRYYGFYPYYNPETGVTNSFHDAMMDSVDVMMDDMGFDGGHMDGFLAGYTGRWSYDTDLRWDGHSAEINGTTKTITRKVNSVILISLPSMIAYARKIREKGGVLVGMHTVFMRSIANEKHIIFTDEATGPGGHLAPNMMALSFPQLTNRKGVYLDILDKLSWGEMFVHYSDPTFWPGLPHAMMSSKQFPITFEEIRGGMVKGKERIVTMNSGSYGWHGDTMLHLVYKFDGRGAAVPNDFITTVGKPDVRTELDLAENESAVIVPIPATLRASAPVNVRVLQHDDAAIRMLINGQGKATLEMFVGSTWPNWRNPPGHNVTVAGITKNVKVVENTGVLAVPLTLDGLVEVVVELVGRSTPTKKE